MKMNCMNLLSISLLSRRRFKSISIFLYDNFVCNSAQQRSQFFMSSLMVKSDKSSVTELSRTSSKTLDKKGFEDSKIAIKWSSDPNAPLVILFGWAGCQNRYLSKYSEIYEKNNCSVLNFTAPAENIKSYPSYRSFAVQVYDTILGSTADETRFPIFFHLFSMNGCALFSSLLDYLNASEKGSVVKDLIKGIIFDSCPADAMPWQAADALSFAMMPPRQYSNVLRAIFRYFLTGYISAYRALIWLRSNFENDIYEQQMAYYRLLNILSDDLPRYQLYLYSKADKLCSAESIEHFQRMQLKRKGGVKLTSKCWTDSPHVEHFRKYPQEYVAECLRFVNCDNNNTN